MVALLEDQEPNPSDLADFAAVARVDAVDSKGKFVGNRRLASRVKRFLIDPSIQQIRHMIDNEDLTMAFKEMDSYAKKRKSESTSQCDAVCCE